MTGFDIVALSVIGLTVALGLWKGLAVQVFGLAGLILGYILSVKYYLGAAKLLPDFSQGTARIAGFLAIFIACIIAAFILGRLFEKLLKFAGLGWANRLFGGVLGLLKGTLIVSVIMVILVAFLPSDSSVMKQSVTVPYLVSVTRLFGAAIPDDIRAKYKSRLELFRLHPRAGEED
ncbi:MAG: CvpA family protein [Thermodesulfovibrionales bacterium]